MSEEENNIVQPVVEEGAPVLDVGATLAAARAALKISVEEAAHQLRLSPRQLYALESNDYSALPGLTFVKGFVRNYARLLQLSPEPLLLALSNQAPESPLQAITLQSEDIAISRYDRKIWLPYAIATVVVCVVLGVWWLYMDYRESHPATEPVAEAMPAPVQEQAVAGGYGPATSVDPAVVPLISVEADEPQAVAPEATPVSPVVTDAKASAEQPAKPTTPVKDSARLKFIFSQQSWVRVTDRDGKEIYHNNRSAGAEDAVEGVPPLKIEVGNAVGVQVSFNDKPVDLAPHTRANVARFTLE